MGSAQPKCCLFFHNLYIYNCRINATSDIHISNHSVSLLVHCWFNSGYFEDFFGSLFSLDFFWFILVQILKSETTQANARRMLIVFFFQVFYFQTLLKYKKKLYAVLRIFLLLHSPAFYHALFHDYRFNICSGSNARIWPLFLLSGNFHPTSRIRLSFRYFSN